MHSVFHLEQLPERDNPLPMRHNLPKKRLRRAGGSDILRQSFQGVSGDFRRRVPVLVRRGRGPVGLEPE